MIRFTSTISNRFLQARKVSTNRDFNFVTRFVKVGQVRWEEKIDFDRETRRLASSSSLLSLCVPLIAIGAEDPREESSTSLLPVVGSRL